MRQPSADAASYAICALPRSGSWLLTFGLEDTGLAGRPRPYLCGLAARDQAARQTRLEHLQLAVRELRRLHASPSGLFGVKLESTDLDEALAWARGDGSFTGDGAELLSALLPGLRYVYLVRQDKTHQAISLLRGLHSHQWMQTSEASASGEWVPEMAAIDTVRGLLIEHEERWETFFAAVGIRPYRVSYEQLGRGDAAYRAAICGVLQHLGVTVREDVRLAQPRLLRQADERTGEWAARYEAWCRGGARAGRSADRRALDRVAALPRQAHKLLGDGRLTLEEAGQIAMAADSQQDMNRVLQDVSSGQSVDEALRSVQAQKAAPRLGSQLLRALSDDDGAAAGAPESRLP